MDFSENRINSLVYMTADNLSAFSELVHGFTTRHGGVSTGTYSSMNVGTSRGDNMDNVRENYAILGRALGFEPSWIVSANQVHGDFVRLATPADQGSGLFFEPDYECDALITDTPNLPLIIFTADCSPVLLYDPAVRAVGAAHAGWKGTALGVAGKTVKEMVRQFGSNPSHIKAAIGPGVGPCCFETDSDVPEAMRKAMGADANAYIRPVGDKWHVDLKGINAYWLRQAGVLPENVSVSNECTACNTDKYWSFRKMGADRGSLGSIIMLRDH